MSGIRRRNRRIGYKWITDVTIKTLILQGEGEQLDFKNRISNCAKIAKTLVAFANTKGGKLLVGVADDRSEEHTSELQSLMRISYAVFCLKNKKTTQIYSKNSNTTYHTNHTTYNHTH